ncbi:MAG TPA: SLBB domain-containing protein [Longimicrobium sp.]|jgi:polysaccharide export outer membrane protein
MFGASIRRHLWIAALVLSGLAGSVFAQGNGASDGLRGGDVIRLRIWREPDLSGEFRVDDEGVAILPRLGPTQVGGQAPAALTSRLVEAYAEFLQHRSIEVVLLRRIQVLGAVRNPGLYSVEPTMTVADALALAGGTTTEGNPRRIDLIRGGRRLPVALAADTRLAATTIRSGDQLFVPERNWLTRNTGIVTTIIAGTISLVIALIR